MFIMNWTWIFYLADWNLNWTFFFEMRLTGEVHELSTSLIMWVVWYIPMNCTVLQDIEYKFGIRFSLRWALERNGSLTRNTNRSTWLDEGIVRIGQWKWKRPKPGPSFASPFPTCRITNSMRSKWRRRRGTTRRNETYAAGPSSFNYYDLKTIVWNGWIQLAIGWRRWPRIRCIN